MANLETPQSLKHVQINNETRIERQADIATSDEPFLLSEANFHEYVIDSETHEMILDRPWFLLFYAPWCGFSQKFMPIWHDFHERNKELVNIASIDCSAQDSKVLCMEYNIMGYPSMRFIPFELPLDRLRPVMYSFQKDRTVEELENFAFNGGYMDAPWTELPNEGQLAS